MLDKKIKEYWGQERFEEEINKVIGIIEENREEVEGIKIQIMEES